MALVENKQGTSFISEENRVEAVARQTLVIQGKGMMHGYKPGTNGYPGDSGRVGSWDMEQALKNKELGYW